MSSPSRTTDDFISTDPGSLLTIETPCRWNQQPLLRLEYPGPAPLQPYGEAHAFYIKRSKQRCFRCHAITAVSAGPPCTPMTATVSVFPVWENPMQMPRLLDLIFLTART